MPNESARERRTHKPLLVLLPALFLDDRSFAPVLSRLSAEDFELEVAQLDMSPNAQTGGAEEALNAYEGALVARIERDGGSRHIVLVGNSLGAYIAARALARVGTLVSHCVALAGLARLPTDVARGRGELADRVDRGEVAVADVIAGLRSLAVGSARLDPEADGLLASMQASLTRESVVWGLRVTSLLDRDSRAVAPFTTPMTLMHGREDASVPFAFSEELARVGANTRLIPLDTDSHVLPLSQPADVARELQTILSELAQRSATAP